MAALNGATDLDKLNDLASRTYKEQAIWFLNAFWYKFETEAEKVWEAKHLFGELDLEKKQDGCALDEMQLHRVLEKLDRSLTVRDLRNKLRDAGAVGDRVKVLGLCHYLFTHHKVEWKTMVNATQGDNQEELQKAQAMLDEATAGCTAAQAAAEAARQAEAELKASQADLAAQQKAYDDKTNTLTAKSEGGGVSGLRAKNELAQHLAEDPLPLRRARITNEAAVKKAERARAAAEVALADALTKVAAAEAYFAEISANSGSAQGAIWWMERELHEAKKFLPLSKGGIVR
eukprot:TRINITY_DN74_c0_g1_i1.p1 TRINITY_DN74_c0_g1~~TRINITY_DN74_c0_g1_i1.p1  ORF type:complete len:303 (+),score=109.63 TRINITY_DN74_c0_g1_i1:44-910(+)